MNFNKFLQILIAILFCVLIPLGVEAVVLYLEPSQGQYQLGDTFIAEARIDTEEECINTVEANLSFSQDVLRAVDFSQGNSILTIWVKPPEINQELGLISFVGGIPGGYCGALPGEPGEPTLLGRIALRAIDETDTKQNTKPHEKIAKLQFLDSSQVLLNDGLGTPAKLTRKGAVFTILAEKLEVPKEEWQEELKKDNIPPEPFEIEIQQDPAIFEGKYFIIFSTTDKQTGIDYYEIKEGKRNWKRVTSPYLLEDQDLKSIIKVKAVDKAGNERIAEYTPEILKKPFPYWIIIIIILVLVIVGWIIYKIIRKR